MEIDVRDLPYYVSVTHVRALDGRRIEVEFNDGNRGTYDMEPLIGSGVFTALRDDELSSSVHVAFGVVTWTDEIDISSERLWTGYEPLGGIGGPRCSPKSTSSSITSGPPNRLRHVSRCLLRGHPAKPWLGLPYAQSSVHEPAQSCTLRIRPCPRQPERLKRAAAASG